MPSPTWFFDGVKRRIYEVPPGASFVVDGDGYRIYDGGANHPLLSTVVQSDLWSRWVDWHALNDWALFAMSKSGGAQRTDGSYQGVDFTLRTSDGWRLVMANYPHETVFRGNLGGEGSDTLFDTTRLTAQGIMSRLQGYDALITFNTGGGGGVSDAPTAAENAAAVLAAIVESGLSVAEILRLVASFVAADATGLDSATPAFKSLDGTKTRIQGSYMTGTRTVTLRDGT